MTRFYVCVNKPLKVPICTYVFWTKVIPVLIHSSNFDSQYSFNRTNFTATVKIVCETSRRECGNGRKHFKSLAEFVRLNLLQLCLTIVCFWVTRHSRIGGKKQKKCERSGRSGRFTITVLFLFFFSVFRRASSLKNFRRNDATRSIRFQGCFRLIVGRWISSAWVALKRTYRRCCLVVSCLPVETMYIEWCQMIAK
jgi:hypothetical protein